MLNPFIHDCQTCKTRCDGVSKGVYIFENDVEASEVVEKRMISYLMRNNFQARKSIDEGYPDIEVFDESGNTIFFIEIKFQRRTFMSVKRKLPESNLEPSETVALNLSDLLRYFEIREKLNKQIFLLYGLQERPCVLRDKKILFFFQDIDTLKKVYDKYTDKRRFRRKSGIGDVVDGIHKGVVVNYHFSLNEFKSFELDSFISSIKV